MMNNGSDIALESAMSTRLVASTLCNKFGIPVVYSELSEGAMVGFLDVEIFFSANWRGSELRISVNSEADAKRLNAAFTAKNLYAKQERDRSMYVFVCELERFLGWSKAAVSWNPKP